MQENNLFTTDGRNIRRAAAPRAMKNLGWAERAERSRAERPRSIPSGSQFGCEPILAHDGRITKKTETVGAETNLWEDSYDANGRLARARLNGRTVGQYEYDPQGRRAMDHCLSTGGLPRHYAYDGQDKLLSMGGAKFTYDGHGRLASMTKQGQSTRYTYDASGFLALVTLPGGRRLTHERDEHGLKRRTLLDGQPQEEFTWLDGLRLASWRDIPGKRYLEFHYAQGQRVPCAVTVSEGGYRYDCALGVDQVGTIKTVEDTTGYLIKELQYDSYGNLLEDSNPRFFLPQGFAGGIRDRHTGLIRFGWRYYMPEAGRFTAPDPARWQGGDPDMYDYCVDDPINLIDPLGLEPQEDGKGRLDSLVDFFGVSKAEAAELVTDMDKGTTTFDPRPEDPDGKPLTIETRNVIDSQSAPGANDPFKTEDIRVLEKMYGEDNQKAFGPDGAYIDTGDKRGRDIHGGGSKLNEPTADYQGWWPTAGCTRGQNKDVITLGKTIKEFQKRHPGVKIPYERKQGK